MNVERTDLEHVIEVTARAGGVGLWEWDLKSNAIRFSREYKRQLGYAEHELPDDFEAWRIRLHPQDYTKVMAAVEAYIQNPRGEFVSEQRLKHRDGSYRWMLARGVMSLGDPSR